MIKLIGTRIDIYILIYSGVEENQKIHSQFCALSHLSHVFVILPVHEKKHPPKNLDIYIEKKIQAGHGHTQVDLACIFVYTKLYIYIIDDLYAYIWINVCN